PRRGTEGAGAETIHVVARRARCHHLDGTAGQAKRHRPQARFAGPGDGLFERRGDDALLETAFEPTHDNLRAYYTGRIGSSAGAPPAAASGIVRTQSMSPRRHRYAKPTSSTAKNT